MHARWMVLALGLSVAACGEDAPEEAATSTPAEPTASTESDEPEMRPVAGGVTWEAEAPLEARRPANAMRKAEYGVRGHEGATLAVFFFDAAQGGGGSVQSNIDRWLGQLEQPDGKPTAEVATQNQREVNGLRVTTVDARGTFVGRFGMGAASPRQGWRVLGAIVEGPQGSVFFKLTGPDAGVTAAEEAFAHLVASLRPI